MKKKYKKTPVLPVTIENGEKVFHLGADMASADPFAYGRLIREGKFEEAQAMEDEIGFRIMKDDGTFV